ncbi:MAG TPA: transglycosylase SLT domain-containing protein [Alphaproteobacteria bacterium]|nr:transglycosylase SLT domain-containing protein [Alphaproteobacteria bacterium]
MVITRRTCQTLLLGAFAACGAVFGVHAQDYSSDPYKPNVAYDSWVRISQAEHAYSIPPGLLHAISLVETGQGIGGYVLPWPYTVGVNSPGSDSYLKPEYVLNRLAQLKKMGFVRFDISADGSARSNVNYADALAFLATHTNNRSYSLQARPFGRRFNNVDEAEGFVYRMFAMGHRNLDIGLMQINWPVHNRHFASVRQALDPQVNLRYAVTYLLTHRTADWWGAVGRYHSGTPKYAKPYILNVWNMYQRIHRLNTKTAANGNTRVATR